MGYSRPDPYYQPEAFGLRKVEQLLNEVHDRLADLGSSTEPITDLLGELPREVLALRGDLP